MVAIRFTGDDLWNRIERAVDKVRKRLDRTVLALEAANIEYAVIGGNAVQLWVAQVNEAAVRNTRDVDILLRENDMPQVKGIMEGIGFYYKYMAGVPMFLESPESPVWDAVHVVYAGKKVREEYVYPAPDVTEFESIRAIRTLSLEALVRMKLTAFRDKDRTHLRDMLELGLIDETWYGKLPRDLGSRLKVLIDSPHQ